MFAQSLSLVKLLCVICHLCKNPQRMLQSSSIRAIDLCSLCEVGHIFLMSMDGLSVFVSAGAIVYIVTGQLLCLKQMIQTGSKDQAVCSFSSLSQFRSILFCRLFFIFFKQANLAHWIYTIWHTEYLHRSWSDTDFVML